MNDINSKRLSNQIQFVDKTHPVTSFSILHQVNDEKVILCQSSNCSEFYIIVEIPVYLARMPLNCSDPILTVVYSDCINV